MNYSKRSRVMMVVALVAMTLALDVGPVSAAPPIEGSMTFHGDITDVTRHGKHCRYTAHLTANVHTVGSGSPEGFTAMLRARWTDTCPTPTDGVPTTITGTADVRLRGIATTADGNPENFTGTATNVSTTAGADPDSFKFKGVTTPDN